MRYLKILAIAVIIFGSYLGIRYIGAVFHYACANPIEDCPPPFYGAGQIAFYITGGELVPLFRR
jgi:hypothetical protein